MSTVNTPINGSLAVEFSKWRFGIQICRNNAARVTCEPPNPFTWIAQERGDGRIQIFAGDEIVTEAVPVHSKHSCMEKVRTYHFSLPGSSQIRVERICGLLRQQNSFALNGIPLTSQVQRAPRGWVYAFEGFRFFVPSSPSDNTAEFTVRDPVLLLPCVISLYVLWLDRVTLSDS